MAHYGGIKHHIEKFTLTKVNDAIELLRGGDIIGRAVIIP
jgi:D-arabinose 1-dehydrogenase-like Zn-dependent alcohol dehydrogenase